MADDPQASMQWQIASYIFHHIYQCHPLALVLLRCAPLSIHLIGIDFHPPEWILYFIYALITFTIFHVITSHSFPLSKNFKFHSTCQIDSKKISTSIFIIHETLNQMRYFHSYEKWNLKLAVFYLTLSRRPRMKNLVSKSVTLNAIESVVILNPILRLRELI